MIAFLFTFLLLPIVGFAQFTDSDGYTGYKLDIREDGDPLAVVYETENTKNNVSSSFPEPDVFLNVSIYLTDEVHLLINLRLQCTSAKSTSRSRTSRQRSTWTPKSSSFSPSTPVLTSPSTE